MLEIDGSFGEGGGQIIRSSLTLSLATGQPFHAFNIRAGRKRPGLLRQHLTAVHAAADVGRAELAGAELHSRELTFVPGKVRPGDYTFDIGTAGSTTLVLQTILPVLLTAKGESKLTLRGGTHNPFAPPFDFVQKTFLPLMSLMGPTVSATLNRPGFYPAGGGEIRFTVEPAAQVARIDLTERGPVFDMRARAVVSKLPMKIAKRELNVIGRKLSLDKSRLESVNETRSTGPGNYLVVEVETEHLTEVITGFGEKGVSAEKVAARTARKVHEYLDAEVPVGIHLADQLLLPLSLGRGGSFITLHPTRHTQTNIEVIETFLHSRIVWTELDERKALIEVPGQQ